MRIRTDESLIVRTPDTTTDYVCHLQSVDFEDDGIFLTFASGGPGAIGWGTLTLDVDNFVSDDVVSRDGEDILVLTFA